jgi:hypothetical protein
MADVAPSVIEPPNRGCPDRVTPLLREHIAYAPSLLGSRMAMVSLRLAAMVTLPLIYAVPIFLS